MRLKKGAKEQNARKQDRLVECPQPQLKLLLWKPASPWRLLSWKERKTVTLGKKNAEKKSDKTWEWEEGCWGLEGRKAIDGQADGGDIRWCQMRPPTERTAAACCFLAHQYEQERNEHLTVMNWGRMAAAKRLLRDILISVNVWPNILNHFHRIRAHNHPVYSDA